MRSRKKRARVGRKPGSKRRKYSDRSYKARAAPADAGRLKNVVPGGGRVLKKMHTEYPPITIGYLTSRKDCKFEWFADGLVRELRLVSEVLDTKQVQVVVVDTKLWPYPDNNPEQRKKQFKDIVDERFTFAHIPPKPSVWQGPNRLTQRDYFCAANSRNTVFAAATGSHVVFVDDLSVLLTGWISGHLHAAKHRYVLCGMTSKHRNLVVDREGYLVKHDAHLHGIDSRLRHIHEDGVRDCSAEWLYGGTFSVPLEAALQVNGQDEIYDSQGGEDYDFGIRLGRAGWSVRINRNCGTIESEELHHVESPMVRLDKPVSVDGPYSSNTLLNRLLRNNNTWTIGNQFNLSELRKQVLSGEEFPVIAQPDRHWVDGQPLREM